MSAAEATTAPAVATEPVATETATAPVVDNTASTAAGTEEPAAATGAATETAAPADATAPIEPVKEKVGKDEVKIEATPVTEGTLAYKAPGLLKFFSKKHFWLGDEAVSHESLSRYLKEEKDTKIGHHNVAHASETGKGLLFFAKRAEDKTAPEGIINLAEATDVTREPGDRFSFKIHGKKHEFHAANRTETEGWTVAIETAIQEAVANKDTVAAGENYKSTHSKLSAPAAAAAGAVGGAAVGTAAAKDAPHDGTAATEATASADKKEARSSSKGRSSSRKRASIFGGLIGKKDEKSVERANEKEAKKEIKEEEKHEKAAEKEAKKEEKAAEKAVEKQQEAAAHADRKAEEIAAAAVAAPVVGEEVKATEPTSSGAPTAITEGTPVATTEATTPTTKQSKRSSVFGFFNKKSGEVPTTKEAAPPAVPAKDTAAPQLDPVDTSVPTDTAATETPAVDTAATAAPVATETASPETHSSPFAALDGTPEAKAANKQKEGGDLFSFMKKKKAEVDEKKAVDSSEGVAAAEKTEGTATSPNTERRRSFFNSLSGAKKERGTSPEGDKKSGLGGLFRKSSKSQKPTTGPVTDSSAPPAIPDNVESGAAATTTEAPVTATTEAAPAAESAAKTEVPAAEATTGTDGLPTTAAATESTPAATAAA